MKWIVGILVIIAAGLGGAYWWAGKDEIQLTEIERQKAPGQFMDLTDGKIHYVLRGPENGPVILMVHGFSTPSFIFEQNASSLAANGFRVIQFDHFGRGWSDRPATKYDSDFYDRSLVELLDQLDVSEPVGLVGLSMGGVISAEFAKRHPERVERLFLLAPAGLKISSSDSLQTQLTKTPVIGDWLWRVSARQVLLSGYETRSAELPEMNMLQGDPSIQMNYRGYFPALLSTLRNLEMSNQGDVFSALAETAIPVLAVFGVEDDVVPIEAASEMRALMPAADIRELGGANHQLNYQDFEIINPWLVEFFAVMLPSPDPSNTASRVVAPE